MPNPFVHIELSTNDLDKAKKFYSALLDWKLTDTPMPDGGIYTMIDVGEGTGGGMMKNPMPGTPSMWMAYVSVDDVDAATKKAKGLGAKVLKEKTEVPGFGWFAMITDRPGRARALADEDEVSRRLGSRSPANESTTSSSTIAPIVALMIKATRPTPMLTLSAAGPNSHVPMTAPMMPTTMLPMMPSPKPPTTFSASQPAIRPTTRRTIRP
jgi:predicted enzyme related to lactoylglutathione lyase